MPSVHVRKHSRNPAKHKTSVHLRHRDILQPPRPHGPKPASQSNGTSASLWHFVCTYTALQITKQAAAIDKNQPLSRICVQIAPTTSHRVACRGTKCSLSTSCITSVCKGSRNKIQQTKEMRAQRDIPGSRRRALRQTRYVRT